MKSETLNICQVSLAGNIPIIKQNIEICIICVFFIRIYFHREENEYVTRL